VLSVTFTEPRSFPKSPFFSDPFRLTSTLRSFGWIATAASHPERSRVSPWFASQAAPGSPKGVVVPAGSRRTFALKLHSLKFASASTSTVTICTRIAVAAIYSASVRLLEKIPRRAVRLARRIEAVLPLEGPEGVRDGRCDLLFDRA
jgi:hypothetical protein